MSSTLPTSKPSHSRLSDVDILLVDDDEQWARVTARLLESAEEAFDVDLAHNLSAGRERFDAIDPDCIICDYQLGDGTGLDLLESVQAADVECPFVLVTGRGDETVASDAIGRGVTDYIPKNNDDTGATLLVNRVRNAVVSSRAQEQLDRERRGKAATLELLASTTSLAGLFDQFCRVLVEDHGYSGAWIGGLEGEPDGGVVPLAVAGCEAYLDAAATDGVVPTGCVDSTVRAVDRDEPVVVSVAEVDRTDSGAVDGQTRTVDERYSDAPSDWQQLAANYGIVTAVGVPIRYDGIRAGVLCVYRSTESPPLDDTQWELLEEYAQIIGYAHRTAELKRSLLSERPVRVDIEITDTSVPLAELTDQLGTGVSAEVLSTIEQADGTTLSLSRLFGGETEPVQQAADACESVEVDNVVSDADGLRCDIRTTVRTPQEILAANGAEVERTVSTNGSVTVSICVADHSVVSLLADVLRSEYDNVTVTTLWNQDDERGSTESTDPLASLTDKQLDVMSHAYFDGYFEQPRGVSATELAAKFDISRATLTQHLRTAQRKVFTQLFTNDRNKRL